MRKKWAAFRRICRTLARVRVLEARAAKDPGADWPADRDYVPVTDDEMDAPIGAVIDGWERRGMGWYRLGAAAPAGAAMTVRTLAAALLGLALLGACRVTPEPCCRRPCTTDAQCNPSLWEVCTAGCCTCTPPDGGTCPQAVAEPEPAAALPGIDAGCP